MVKKLKRLLAPKFWKVSKKAYKWVVSPKPGPHPKSYCIPLLIIVRDILRLVEKGREAKMIIKRGEILVDGKQRKDHAYPAGLFDVISIPKLNQHYRIVPTLNGLELIKIPEKEANKKICKVVNKTLVKGRTQLNLSDGKNVFVKDKNYKTGDSLLLELPSLKILDHISLTPGNIGIVSKGKYAGKVGKIKEVIEGTAKEEPKVVCEIEGKKQEILKDRFFVVGKERPLIKISE